MLQKAEFLEKLSTLEANFVNLWVASGVDWCVKLPSHQPPSTSPHNMCMQVCTLNSSKASISTNKNQENCWEIIRMEMCILKCFFCDEHARKLHSFCDENAWKWENSELFKVMKWSRIFMHEQLDRTRRKIKVFRSSCAWKCQELFVLTFVTN